VSIYNAEIRGLYNYYKLAHNVSGLDKFKYIMEYSMYKTFARKYKMKMGKIIDKYNINGNFGVKYTTKNGEKIRYFYNEGFKKQKLTNIPNNEDIQPNTLSYSGRTTLEQRLLANKCEWCGRKDTPLEIHHIRKVKDLKGKKAWEKQMIARQRKTMALCVKCHDDLHAGRLD
jgi:hypothetical protein